MNWLKEHWLQVIIISWVVASIATPLWVYERQQRIMAEVGDDLMLQMAKACNEIQVKNKRRTTRWVVFDVYHPIRGRQIVCNDAKAIFVPLKPKEGV